MAAANAQRDDLRELGFLVSVASDVIAARARDPKAVTEDELALVGEMLCQLHFRIADLAAGEAASALGLDVLARFTELGRRVADDHDVVDSLCWMLARAAMREQMGAAR